MPASGILNVKGSAGAAAARTVAGVAGVAYGVPADTALPATAADGSGVVQLGGAMPGAAVLAALDRSWPLWTGAVPYSPTSSHQLLARLIAFNTKITHWGDTPGGGCLLRWWRCATRRG
jgi:hypothetical protein